VGDDLDNQILIDILSETRETSKAIGGLTASVDTIKADTKVLHERISEAKSHMQAHDLQIDQHRLAIATHDNRLNNIDKLTLKVVAGIIGAACVAGGGGVGMMKIIEMVVGK